MVTDVRGRMGRDGRLKKHGYHSQNLHTARGEDDTSLKEEKKPR